MARIVPGIKRTLEEFILRVKVVLQVNDCVDLFWVGNLKNRTISGQIVEPKKAETSDSSEEEEGTAQEEEGSADGEEGSADEEEGAAEEQEGTAEEESETAEEEDSMTEAEEQEEEE